MIRYRHGQKAEKHASKRLKARLSPGSGSIGGYKGDFGSDAYLFESKATVNESISIKLEWLRKISCEAIDTNREPVLCVQFVNTLGHPAVDGNWILIPERVFRELVMEGEYEGDPP